MCTSFDFLILFWEHIGFQGFKGLKLSNEMLIGLVASSLCWRLQGLEFIATTGYVQECQANFSRHVAPANPVPSGVIKWAC